MGDRLVRTTVFKANANVSLKGETLALMRVSRLQLLILEEIGRRVWPLSWIDTIHLSRAVWSRATVGVSNEGSQSPGFRASFSRSLKRLEAAGVVERRASWLHEIRPTLRFTALAARRSVVMPDDYRRRNVLYRLPLSLSFPALSLPASKDAPPLRVEFT